MNDFVKLTLLETGRGVLVPPFKLRLYMKKKTPFLLSAVSGMTVIGVVFGKKNHSKKLNRCLMCEV